MADCHLPVSFLFDEALTLERLKPYAVIYVPDAVSLSEEVCSVLREYVRQGGGIVATGLSSLRDESGKRRPDLGLTDLFGAHYEGLLREPFVYWGTAGLTCPLFYRGQCVRVRAEGETMGNIWEPARLANRRSGPLRETPLPIATFNGVGDGNAVYVVGSPEGRYAETGLPEYRWLISQFIKRAASAPPPYWVDAPSVVETVGRSLPDGGQVFHFLSAVRSRPMRCGGLWSPEVIEDVLSVYDIRLHVAAEPWVRHRAYLLPGMEPLRVSHEENEVMIDVPEVRLWNSVLVSKG